MNKTLLLTLVLGTAIGFAQNERFDASQALLEAKQKGLAPVDYQGYVKARKLRWMGAHGLIKKTTPVAVQKKNPNSVTSSTNIDFESGNYNGWGVTVGENMTSSNGPLQNIRTTIPGGNDTLPTVCDGLDPGRHGLMTTMYNDPVCGIPLASPLGGNYIARVNRYCANFEAAVLTQSFLVTPAEKILNYVYATVLEDGGHAWGEQTYFKVLVKDQNGALIDSVYMQAANGTTPGFYPTLGGNSTYTYYKPWTPVTVDLSAYIGQNVTIEVTGSACIYGGHSGYAYFDARLDSVSAVPNVWPGDANYDLTADVNDLFYIGWAYGASGPVRSGATNTWQAEPSADWGQSTAYGTEYKHADCNGDGTIDDNDTLAILLNYGLQHAFRQAADNSVSSLSNYRNLYITPGTTTVGPNQPLALAISLPTATVSANDIYGISFRVLVPSQYIAALSAADFSGSFIGAKGTNMLTLAKAQISQDHIDICLVKKDHVNATGGGNLMTLNLNTTNFTTNGSYNFKIIDIKAVTYQGTYLPIGSQSALMNFNTAVGINKLSTESIRVLPNPASDRISLDGLNEKTTFEIVNIIGQPVLKGMTDSKAAIDISSFEAGAYFLKLHSAQGTIIRKFIKE